MELDFGGMRLPLNKSFRSVQKALRLQPIVGWIFDSCRIYLFAGIIYCLPQRKNNTVKFIVFLKQNNSESFIGASKILFSFKRRPNINLYVEYSRT